MKIRSVVYALVGVLASALVHGAVSWETKELDITAVPGQAKIDFAFPFKNEGPGRVQFSAPTASCDCTLATLEKSEFPVSAAGVIKGSYDLVGRHGENSVIITVRGSEGDGDTRRSLVTTLKLRVIIPEFVKISPRIVLWGKDSKAEPRTIRFEVDKSSPLKLELVGAAIESFKVEWREMEVGRLYEAVVTPVSTLDAGSAMITIEAPTADGKRLKFHAHLLVR